MYILNRIAVIILYSVLFLCLSAIQPNEKILLTEHTVLSQIWFSCSPILFFQGVCKDTVNSKWPHTDQYIRRFQIKKCINKHHINTLYMYYPLALWAKCSLVA